MNLLIFLQLIIQYSHAGLLFCNLNTLVVVGIKENVAPLAHKLRSGRTRCIRLSCNGINDKEELEFNAKGRVCSKNVSMFT